MTVQPLLLQLLFGEMCPQETARHLYEACIETIGQDQLDATHRDALREYFGQPESRDA